MVLKILFRWGKTMTLKTWIAYKEVELQRRSLSVEKLV